VKKVVFSSPVGCTAQSPMERGCDKQYFHTVNTTLLSIKPPKVNDKLFSINNKGVVMVL
jgi:hypothetical protein